MSKKQDRRKIKKPLYARAEDWAFHRYLKSSDEERAAAEGYLAGYAARKREKP